MKKRRYLIFFAAGGVLILFSLVWVIILQLQLHLGSDQSDRVVAEMEAILPDPSEGELGVYADPGMPTLQIDGVDYVAMIEIPAFDIKLPVANRWDSSLLSDAPARFSGSAYDSTLVIGGTDYSRQFAFCDQIELDTTVILTDMTGAQFLYRVSAIHRSDDAKREWLTDGAGDLTLFCKDTYSMQYIAVRCQLKNGQ